MARLKVHITYIVLDTVRVEQFICDAAYRTMTHHSTSVVFTNGVDESGSPVEAVLYRDAVRILTTRID